MTEREFAIEVVKKLQEAGFRALWAGGCVRDELLGLVPKDYDVATNARPEEVRKLFRRTVAVGMSFGVVEVIGPREDGKHLIVQVATFRSDVSYSDGRRPDAVVFSSPEEDAQRRDFTVNGMFHDPIKEELIDYVGGRQDLQNKILRAIGNPALRFDEDKLRLLRAVRIATRFDLSIEPETGAAIRAMADQIGVVSAERIAEELRQLLIHPRRVRGVKLLWELGLIKPIVPELLRLKGFLHPCPHDAREDLWAHVLRVLDLLGPEVPFPLALAALLHETGKPVLAGQYVEIQEEGQTPEKIAARITEEIVDRLRLSNAEKDRAVWLVEHYRSLEKARELRISTLKRLFVHPGIQDLLRLQRAEALANGQSTDAVDYCEDLLNRWTAEDIDPPALVTGNDLKNLGLKPGPRYKELLDAVREAQLDGEVKTKQEAVRLIKRLLENG